MITKRMGAEGKTYWVYIMSSEARGVLYVGMTSDIANRAREHREGLLEGFTKRYRRGRLVYFEAYTEADVASRRERLMKRWRRDWKIALVESVNPTWRDLFDEVVRETGFEPSSRARQVPRDPGSARARFAHPLRPGTQQGRSANWRKCEM